MKLANKTAVITGGNQGFGFAVAEAFVKEGANVVICARDESKLKEAENLLLPSVADNARVVTCVADISKYADNEKVVQTAVSEFGGIDILVANAGIYGPKGKIEEVDWEEWCHAIDVNLKGTVLSCRCAIPEIKKASKGKIIILSGGGATKPMPNLSAYATSKAGVVRFAETLAEELREYKIDVNTIAPGALNTRLLDEILQADPQSVGRAFYEQSLKQKQNGGVSPAVGAALCVFLAGQESDGISGKLISAVWDPWVNFGNYYDKLTESDIYTLRRIVPEDRNLSWS